MTAIVTDQATVDRWLADGRWVEHDGGVWRGAAERLAVQVPCPDCEGEGTWGSTCTDFHEHCYDPRCITDPDRPCGHCTDGLITVAWATVEWGPLPVLPNDDDVGSEPCLYYSASSPVAALWYMKATPDGWHVPITLPPDVDPQTLIGQWARGGSIEATA